MLHELRITGARCGLSGGAIIIDVTWSSRQAWCQHFGLMDHNKVQGFRRCSPLLTVLRVPGRELKGETSRMQRSMPRVPGSVLVAEVSDLLKIWIQSFVLASRKAGGGKVMSDEQIFRQTRERERRGADDPRIPVTRE